jgi:hypothetical protein
MCRINTVCVLWHSTVVGRAGTACLCCCDRLNQCAHAVKTGAIMNLLLLLLRQSPLLLTLALLTWVGEYVVRLCPYGSLYGLPRANITDNTALL